MKIIPKFLIKQQTYNFPLFPLKPPLNDQEFRDQILKSKLIKNTQIIIWLLTKFQNPIYVSIIIFFFNYAINA